MILDAKAAKEENVEAQNLKFSIFSFSKMQNAD